MALVNPSPLARTIAQLAGWVTLGVGLDLLYALIFMTTESMGFGSALLYGAANVMPLMALMAVLWLFLPRFVNWRTTLDQAVWHFGLAMIFTVAWYSLARIGVATIGLLRGSNFHLSGMNGPALVWQVFQGLILYTAVAALAYARGAAPIRVLPAIGAAASRTLERYLVRGDEDYRPVEVADIVTIAGAQDYSEVSTRFGRHLVRMSLAEFEAKLDPARFIRVHRSTIIHLAYLERVELAGGKRMLAHMTNGERARVSRAGAKALRSLIV